MKLNVLLKRTSLLGVVVFILASCAAEPARKVASQTDANKPKAKNTVVAPAQPGKVRTASQAPVIPIKIKPKAVAKAEPATNDITPAEVTKPRRLYPTDSKFYTPTGPRRVSTPTPTKPVPEESVNQDKTVVPKVGNRKQLQSQATSAPEPVPTRAAAAPVTSLKSATQAVQVTLEALPITVANWTLDYDPQRMQNHCYLQSAKQTMPDGQGESTVFAQISAMRIAFITDSNIDTAYADSGVQVDLNPRIDIESLYRETAIVYEQSADELLKQLLVGKSVVLTLGFWPTWPMTRSYSLEIDLSEFGRAFQALQLCDAML